MAIYSIQDIANARGYSYQATRNHIQNIIKKKKFVKTGEGVYFNDVDIEALEKLLGFKMPKKINGQVPKQMRLKF